MKHFYEKGLSYAVRQTYLKGILLAFFLLGLSSARMDAQVWTINVCSGMPGDTQSATYGPMNSTATANATNRLTSIYPASQLSGIANQVLTGVYFHTESGNVGGMLGTPNFKVWLKEVSQDNWGSGALDWATASAGATLVFDGNPASIIGTTGGWKEFPFITNFPYSGTQNLALFVEYTNPSASNTINWSYEYTSPCVSGSSSGTETKYSNNTTGTLPASLGSTNSRRPYIAFDMVVPCPAPTHVTVSGITQTGASITWTAGGTETSWDYAVQPAGTGTPTVWTTTTTPSVTPALSPGTQYEFYVRANCGGATGESIWKVPYVFQTLCAPYAVPYYQNFDTSTVGSSTNNTTPTCWTYYETPGGTGYGYVVASAANAVSTPNAYYLYRASATTGPVMLISPETPALSSGTNRVRFSAKATAANKLLEIGTLTNPADPATFTVLQTLTLTTTQTEYDVNIPAGTAAYIAFNNATAGSASTMYIDEVFVEPMPTCFPPESPAFGTIGSNAVGVSWSAPTSGPPAASYMLYYSTNNVMPDATTVLDATNSVTVTGTSATITGLSDNTTYYVWMRTTCSASDSSYWVPVGSVLTACLPMAAPWTYDVETATATTGAVITDCWSTTPSNTTSLYRWDVDAAGSTPSSSTGPSAAHSGVKYFYTEASSGSAGSIAELYTPYINVSALTIPSLQFYYHMYGATMGELRVDVYDGASWNNDLFVLTGQQQTSDTAPWLKATVHLGSLTITGPIQVRFRSVRSTDFYGDMALDDISVVEAPTCVAPANVNVVSFQSATATIGWDAAPIAPANGYQVYYSTVNTAPDATTVLDATNSVNAAGLTANLTGLTPASTYYVWVRSDCGAGNVSEWTQVPVTFVTLCAPVATLFENFDSYGTGAFLPECWTRLMPPSGTAGTLSISLTSPASGTRNVYQLTSAANVSGIAVLPEFSNVNAGTHWLKFKARTTSTSLPGALEVGYVADATDWNSFVNLQTLDITNNAYDATYYTVVIPTWIPATARLAIKNPSDAKAYYWDDVYWEVIPTCFEPTNMVMTGATSSSLDISWTAPVGSPAPVQGYEYYYSQTNTPPTAATPASGTSATTSATITGLTGDTVYYVWVRSVCSATDTSSWSAMLQATTGYCTPVQTGTSTTYYLAEATTTGAMTNLNYTATSHQSYVNTAEVFSTYPTGTFDYFLDGSGTSTYNYYIWVDWNNNLNFNDPGETVLATTTKTATHAGTLTIPAGTPYGMYRVRIAASFSGVPTTACGDITSGNYVDMTLNVVPPPSCVAPANIQISNITHNSATIGWDASITPPAMGYDVYYSATNTPPTATTVPQVANAPGLSVNITGLAPITTYYVWVRSHCSGTDQSSWTSVPVTVATLCQPPAITGTTGATVCPTGATATLTATADAGATITWYDAATGGNVVGTGGTYTTPPLTATTDYWVTASVGQPAAYVGKDLPTATSGNSTFSNYGLIFDAFQPMKIEEVDVYPMHASNTTGTVTINLKDSNGNILQSKVATVNVSVAGVKNTISLDFIVPSAGTDYRLVVDGATDITNLRREITSGFSYPYTLAGVCSITAASFGANPSASYYYYLYNWKVSTGCESARTQVTATLDPVCLSTSEVEGKDSVRVYPNPFTDVINISDAKDLKSVTVMDASGRMVKTIANPGAQIHLGELKSGLYLLNLRYADGNTTTVKVIKR